MKRVRSGDVALVPNLTRLMHAGLASSTSIRCAGLSCTVRVLFAFAVALACCAAAKDISEPDVTPLIRQRKAAAQNKHLNESEKKQIVSKYNDAIRFAQDVARFRTARAAHERQKAALDRETRALHEELLRPALYSVMRETPTEDSQAVEEALDRALAERNVRMRILMDLSRNASEVTKRQNDTGKRRAELRIAAEAADDELASVRVDSGPEPSQAAFRAAAQWRKTAVQAELEALNAERDVLQTRRSLIPLQRDAAKLQLEAADRAVEDLNRRSRAARAREAARELSRVQTIAQEVTAASIVLKPAASDVVTLSNRMWGPSGAIATQQDIVDLTARMKLQLAWVKDIAASIERRYESASRLAPVGEWVPHIPADLPDAAEVLSIRRRTLTREAELRRYILSLEEQRRTEAPLETQIEQLRGGARAGRQTGTGEVEARAREVLQLRRNLAEDLVRMSQELDTSTREFSDTSADLLREIESLKSFASQRVLWARSTAGLPSPKDASLALMWFVWNPEWKDVVRTVVSSKGALAVGVLVVVALIFLRRHYRSTAVGPSATLVCLTLLAAAAPAVLVWIGTLVDSPEGPALGRALRAGCTAAACSLFPILFLWRVTADVGVAERHFGWPATVVAAARRELKWLQIALPFAWFFVAAVAGVGSLFSDPPELQAAHNSLGRYAFFTAMLCLLFSAARLLKPDGAVRHFVDARANREFVTRVLLRRGTIYFLIGALFLLAAVGFFTTALVLAKNTFWTVSLTAALGITASVMARWHEERKRLQLAATTAPPENTRKDEAQVRQLTRFALAVVWTIAALSIWSNVFPAFTRLDQVQLLPATTSVPATSALQISPGPQKPESTTPSVPRTRASKPLTLLDVLEAAFAGTITIILVKNVPGVVNFLALHRLRLDSGASYAAGAVTRYVVMIVGVAVVSGILGINWSQVQWLVAALTFGVGFGLQEIFANFASGLILLFDRSIRVGDAVSVGELSGRVSRIQMRATTVTLWDRSEMIVPNKEFITSKLINWTLSLPETRVDVKVGVAYGSDLDLVRRVLYEVAATNPNVLHTPAPEVLLTAFADSSITFELRAYCLYEFGRMLLLDQLHTAVYREFEKRGISIAFPQLDVHVQQAPMNAQAGATI